MRCAIQTKPWGRPKRCASFVENIEHAGIKYKCVLCQWEEGHQGAHQNGSVLWIDPGDSRAVWRRFQLEVRRLEQAVQAQE